MADKKDKATKRILENVVYHDRTFGPGDEDDLEQRLTKDRYERIMQQEPPPLAGDWHPKGKGDEPMQRSRAAVGERRGAAGAFGPHPAQPNKPHPADAENERLRAENEKLKAEVEKQQAAESRAAHTAQTAHTKAADKAK